MDAGIIPNPNGNYDWRKKGTGRIVRATKVLVLALHHPYSWGDNLLRRADPERPLIEGPA